MVSQRRLTSIVILILLTGLLLVACERPLPGTSSTETPTADTNSTVITDENAGGGTPNDAETGTTTDETGATEGNGTTTEPATDDSAGSTDTPREEESSDATTDEATAPATEGYPAPADEAATEETPATDAPADDTAASEDAATSDTAAAEAADTTTATDTTASDTTTTDTAAAATTEARPASHIVAAGENLYRIGLKYGVSWVTLAQANGLTNANRIVVGQELKIPGDTTMPTPPATPSPQTEEVYVVKAGDTLFRIGQAYGLSWTQIAEANGIVNPNQIIVGQQLKIPVDKPSSTQQSFVHTVQSGETLFIISLRYGVAWPAIAEANKLETPYVIFPGQTLVIPGK